MNGADYAIAAYVLGLGILLGYGVGLWWRLLAKWHKATATGEERAITGHDQAEAESVASDDRNAEPASASRAR